MTKITDILDQVVATVETALADVKEQIGCQVEPRRVLLASTPTIDMFPADPTRDETSLGFSSVDLGSLVFILRARIGTADQDAGQDFLLALMDEEDLDLVGALQRDQTLNGLASGIHLEGPFGHTLYQDVQGQQPALGIQWRMTIIREIGVS